MNVLLSVWCYLDQEWLKQIFFAGFLSHMQVLTELLCFVDCNVSDSAKLGVADSYK
jgi:hypothetical protein